MKDIVITLNRNELTYGIDYLCYKVAKVHFSQTDAAVADEVSSTPSDKDYIDQLTAGAIENIRDELRWCLARRSHLAGSDKVDDGQADYDIVLRVRDDSGVEPATLGRLMHDYVVYRVAYQYLLLSAPAVAPSLASLAEAALNKVYLHTREERPTRPPRLW